MVPSPLHDRLLTMTYHYYEWLVTNLHVRENSLLGAFHKLAIIFIMPRKASLNPADDALIEHVQASERPTIGGHLLRRAAEPNGHLGTGRRPQSPRTVQVEADRKEEAVASVVRSRAQLEQAAIFGAV